MNNKRIILCIGMVITILCAPIVAQDIVTFQIKVVKDGTHGHEGYEVPVAGEIVYVTLFSGNVEPAYTNSEGIAQFSFPPTAYATIYIGDPRRHVKLARMSGRSDQVTSVYLIGGHAAPSNADVKFYNEIRDFAYEVKAGRTFGQLPEQLSKKIRGIKADILNPGIFENDAIRVAREAALRELDEALEPVRRIGVTCFYDDSGSLVDAVSFGGPADRAGIKKGDRITKIGIYKISSHFQIPRALARINEGAVPVSVISPNEETRIVNVDAQ